MRLILNIISGCCSAVCGWRWATPAALICFVLIVTIPFGFASLADCGLRPAGLWSAHHGGAPRPGALVGNIIWVLLCGVAGDSIVSSLRGSDGDHDHRIPPPWLNLV